MDIGIFQSPRTIDDAVQEARRVADDGFGSFYMPQIFGLEALTTLAIVAREVPGIELGTGVVPTYRQHPMALAGQALTVSQASGGRLVLGIGLSHQIVVEQMWGLSFDKPLRHMREYLDALLPLLRGEPTSVAGETIVARGQLDVAAPAPAVVIAALGPKMLELAGRVADGTATWMVGPATLAAHTVPTITEAAEAAGRPAPRVVVALPVCVTADTDRARARAAEEFAVYGQLPSYRAMLDREDAAGPQDVAIIGTADEVADRIRHVVDCGATTFVASEFGSADERAQTREVLRTLLG